MPKELLILTGELEAGRLGTVLGAEAPGHIDVTAISGADELERCVSRGVSQTRLISFCTGVIVPPSILGKLALEPYNVHPGSPEYPGIYPEAFAVYDGATRFGTTAHVMAETVDTGEIVKSDWFDVPEGWDREQLAARVYEAALGLFFELALVCLKSDAPLPRSGESWTGPRRTREQYRALCQPVDDPREAEKRARAVKPHYAMTRD